MENPLRQELFLAVAAVAHADGRLTREEGAGLTRAAKECGLSEEACQSLAAAVEKGVELDEIDLGELSGWERGLTYALATFITQVDGSLHAEEREALSRLGERLGLPEAKLKAAASAAFDIACLPGGHRPDKYDFAGLAERLKVKLPSLASES